MDIHAGHMIQVGPRNVIANEYLAVPISITVEGANILTRCLIIFGQGAMRCHPYIFAEYEAAREKDDVVALPQFERVATARRYPLALARIARRDFRRDPRHRSRRQWQDHDALRMFA